MTTEEYIKFQANELFRLAKKRDKLSEDLFKGDLSAKAFDKKSADLNWTCMEIYKYQERIGYVLGYLKLDEVREYYEPSGFHRYKGIREELSKLSLKP
jgi:hypothetical protein